MEIIAHRGASRSAPENTLPAFRLAWRQGADAAELDIHLSRDGRIVVTHDASALRTAGLDRKVCGLTLDELRALDFGRWKGAKWAGTRILTLEEVVQTAPAGKRLLIEIKCGPEIIPALRKFLDGSGKHRRRFILQSFSLPTMEVVKREFPDIEAAWLCGLSQPTAPEAARETDALIRQAVEAGMNGLHLRASPFMDARMVKDVKAARLKFRVWTVDSAPIARRLAGLGIDGIITNRPGWIRARLTPLLGTGLKGLPKQSPLQFPAALRDGRFDPSSD
jgi:glycerophosphoryl diester phosphodiesterase